MKIITDSDYEPIINVPDIKAKPLTTKDLKNIKLLYSNNKPEEIKEIEAIFYKSTHSPNHIFKDLYKLVYNENLLFQSAGNVSQNIGATTPGIDNTSSDALNIKRIEKIHLQLKNNTYKFKPIKRLYIDKTGKNPNIDKITQQLYLQNKLTKIKMKELKVRPLGILTFSDKLISEQIRLILNAIYEPSFRTINLNFGFRPLIGVQEAIAHHKSLAKSHTFMLEADITGAFDNVNHDKLINILKKRIDDDRFINLIKKGLECGAFYVGVTEETKIGTTQGSIVSPLLYNIYFHEFDKYISSEFETIVNNINLKENRINNPINPLYVRTTKLKAKIKIDNKLAELQTTFQNKGKNSPEYIKQLFEWYESRKLYKILDKQQKNLTSVNFKRKLIRFTYTRYADDWIFSSNCSLDQMREFKNIFTNWILDNLELNLSEQKTFITPIQIQKNNRNSITPKFLGFTLSYYSDSKHIKAYGINKKTRTDTVIKNKFILTPYPKIKSFSTIKTKVISHTGLIIAIDRSRLLNRLIESRIIKKKGNQYFGTRKTEWTTLQITEIVNKFNQIIRGYLNYYCINLSYPSELNSIHYLLKYSCIHTLANKLNCSTKKIMNRFTKDIKVSINVKTKVNNINTEKKITSNLLTWKDCQQIMRTAISNYKDKHISPFQKKLEEIPSIKVNWRTKLKLTQYCCICGSTENIEYHHVRHIKIGKTEGFLQVMKQLNRKQIPTCQKCHQNIHYGRYNNVKLSDLFDERIVVL